MTGLNEEKNPPETDDGIVRVFVSHKHEDRELAKSIKEIVEPYAPSRLECFISGENIVAGEDWKKRVKQELRKSNLLLLLFTQPAKEWDWCLFEAGLFTPLLSDDDRRRIVCIHPPDSDGPRPLTNLQGVKADPENMGKFLVKFFHTSEITKVDPPLNPKINKKTINEMARQICDLFGPHEILPHYTCSRLELSIPRELKLKKNAIPREAVVRGDASSLAIFGLAGGDHLWGEVVDSVGRHGTSDWVEEIGKAFHLAAKRHVIEPARETFRSANGGKIFRPVLYKVALENGRPVTASVVITEELTPPDVGGPMFRLLKMSTRFGEEVISPYIGKMAELADVRGAAAVLRQLLESVETIELESEKRGFKDEKNVQAYFGSDEAAKAKVGEMFGSWGLIREKLVIAVETEDLELAETVLRDMDRLQREFILLAAERYLELVRQDNAHLLPPPDGEAVKLSVAG